MGLKRNKDLRFIQLYTSPEFEPYRPSLVAPSEVPGHDADTEKHLFSPLVRACAGAGRTGFGVDSDVHSLICVTDAVHAYHHPPTTDMRGGAGVGAGGVGAHAPRGRAPGAQGPAAADSSGRAHLLDRVGGVFCSDGWSGSTV